MATVGITIILVHSVMTTKSQCINKSMQLPLEMRLGIGPATSLQCVLVLEAHGTFLPSIAG